MFKAIPKSDVIVRPFKVYKDWAFDHNTLPPNAVRHLSGSYDDNLTSFITGSGYSFNEYVFDRALRNLYYNGTPKLVGTVTNWNLIKHKRRELFRYSVLDFASNATTDYKYYYDASLGRYVDEFQDYLTNNQLFVSDLGQVLANHFPDITKLYGFMKSLGSVQERYIGNRYFVWIIPQKYVGEEIKPGSFKMIDYGRTKSTFNGTDEYITIRDDGFGNLIEDQTDYIGIRRTDMQVDPNQQISPQTETPNSTLLTTEGILEEVGIKTLDFGDEATKETERLSYDYDIYPSQKFEDIDRVDYQNSYLRSSGSNEFPPSIDNPTKIVGNIFYANGIITLTHQTELDEDCTSCPKGENAYFGNNGFLMTFQSTKTIFENEIFLTVRPHEFNVSTNPTATTWKDGGTYVNTYIEIAPPGLPYSASYYDYDFRIPSAIDAAKKAGFGDYEKSSSLDPTGSFLAPYVTSIGLYDDEYNLVAVAKVPLKPKVTPDYPLNFIVRFDT